MSKFLQLEPRFPQAWKTQTNQTTEEYEKYINRGSKTKTEGTIG